MRNRRNSSFILFIASMMLMTVSIVRINDRSDEKEVLDIMVECYGSTGVQCGLHNMLEEGDYEDVNILWHRTWIEENELGLTEEEQAKALRVINYMEQLTVAERETLLHKMYELHRRKVNP